MESLCIKCKGKGFCGKPCKILERFKESAPKPVLHFSGPSPPEIFVGRIGYPNVNTGILAPTDYETKHSELNTAEEWAKNNLSIANILRLRAQLIYGKNQVNIKKTNKIKEIVQELALTHKSVSTEVFLAQKPIMNFMASSVFNPITNSAIIRKAIIEENIKVHKKIDYLVSDYDAKSVSALKELYEDKIKVDHLQKLLSAGLLGVKINRRMVPTRWSITAVDDIISKNLIEKIKYYSEISQITLLYGNYLNNFIYALLLPNYFSFEAIEVWQTNDGLTYAQDFEGFNGRKKYAENITGGYYAMRLAAAEYLNFIKKQASVFILREITEDYYAPLGVGIVREATRNAFKSNFETFDNIKSAIDAINKKLKLKTEFKEKSWTIINYGKQKKISDFAKN